MIRMLSCSFAFFVLALGIAKAVPARPLYEPPLSATPPSVIVNLNGSAWLGKYQTINRVFIFEADGSLSYQLATGKAGKAAKIYKNRGTWKHEGNSVYFDYFVQPGRKLMEFRGILSDANTIVGEATYPLSGAKAEQTLKRSPQ